MRGAIRACPRCHNLRVREEDFSRALNGEWRLWCNACCDRFRALPTVKAEAAFWASQDGRELHARLMASFPARRAAGWATSPMPTTALDRLKASPSSTAKEVAP